MKTHITRLISQTLHKPQIPFLQNPNFPLLRPFSSTPEQKPQEPQNPKPIFSEKVSQIAEELSSLTLLETADLGYLLSTKAGIKAMPGMFVMMPGMGFAPGASKKGGGPGAGKEEEKKEKTSFDLKLEGGFDAGSKIKIIKEVRACTDLGLKEAKDLVEKAPTLLKKGVTKDEAEKIVGKMKEIGAVVVIE